MTEATARKIRSWLLAGLIVACMQAFLIWWVFVHHRGQSHVDVATLIACARRPDERVGNDDDSPRGIDVLRDAFVEDLNQHDSAGKTPLMVALEFGQPSAVEALLRRGVDLQIADRDGWTALHTAVRHANWDAKLVTALVEAGAPLNAQDVRGGTPLHLAAMSNDTRSAAALLRAGADPTVRDRLGRTAADVAAGLQEEQMIQTLQDYAPAPASQPAGRAATRGI